MFEQTISLLDEILADDKTKKSIKKKVHPKKAEQPSDKPKKKRKKKKKVITDGAPVASKRKKKAQAANDDSPNAQIEHSIGSLQGKMSMKMDTSANALNSYKQSLSGFAKIKSDDSKAPPTGSDGASVHSEDDKKRDEAATAALNDGMKVLDHKPEDMARDIKDLADEKKENPEKPVADIINGHKNKASMSKTALIIGGSVLAAGLFIGFAAMSPGVAIAAGMHVLDHAMSPEISGRILDHILSKKDKDETEDEPKSNNNDEDEKPRHSRRNTQEEDDAEEQENGPHRQADSLLGDGVEAAVKETVNAARNDPKTAEAVTNGINEGLKKEQNKPDMSPIEDKKGPEFAEAWAKRAEEYANKGRDPSLSEEERNEHKRAARIATGISLAPKQQTSMLETYHANNAKPVAQKEPEHGDEDEDDEGGEEQPPFPDKKEEKIYQKSVDTVMDHESDDDKIHPDDIKSKHGLNDEQANKFLDRMEKEGFVGKAGKDGRREIYGDDSEDEEPEDEPEPPKSSKGKKVQSAELNDVDACLELTSSLDWEIKNQSNAWLELAALLNYRMKTDGIKGNGQDNLDSLGPDHVGPFEPSPYFGEEPEDNGISIDYAQNPNKPTSVLDRIIKRYNVESLMDMDGDFTKTIKAPTYAALKINPVSARLLKDWCEKRGIKGVYPKHEFHITVCYSKDPIDYKPTVFTDGPKQVHPLKFDLLGREDDKKFVVLKLQKGFPHKRFEYSQSIGASHDFPEYLPHISISPPGHGMMQDDVDALNNHIDDLKVPLLVDFEYMDELKARLLLEAAETKFIEYFQNSEGLRSEVVQIGEKYHVILKDTEANKTLPVVEIFKDKDKAINYAKSLVDEESSDESNASTKNTKYELEVNDGDKSILDILLQIKKHSLNGHSFPVKIDEGHDETKHGVDGDGADKLISVKVDGKKLSRQEEKERLNKYKKEAVKADRPFVDNIWKIGVAGYSGQKYDQTIAKNLLFRAVSDSVAKAKQAGYSQIELVSGLTNVGIPGQAYQIAKRLKLKTSGIACAKANEYDCYPVDNKIIVGTEWGDESQTFVNYIDELITIGGGNQTKSEAEKVQNAGKPVHKFELETLPK